MMDYKIKGQEGFFNPYGNIGGVPSKTGGFNWFAAADVANNIATSWANYGLQKKNLDYQKELQREIFTREDTAVQRRMADLKAAGINPYMASDSSASAGSVVSTSAPQIQNVRLGQYLDTKMALEQVEQAKEATRQAIMQSNIMRADENIARNESQLSNIDRMIQEKLVGFYNGDYDNAYKQDPKSLPPFLRTLYSDLTQYENAAELSTKQRQWFIANQLTDMVSKFFGSGAAAANAVTSGIKNVEQSRNYRSARQKY